MSDEPNITPQPDDKAPEEPEESPQTVGLERVETLLANGHLEQVQGAMLWGSNYALAVTVSDDELQTMAVYKPQRGERPLWDFPDGTLCYRELLAYQLSKCLGWFLVPPTVLRVGPHGLGSVQFFIEHDPEINYFSLDDHFVDQLQRFAVFDAIVNNTDRKGGHLLMDAQHKLWGIDHGLTFHALPKLRTVIWEFAGASISPELLADILRLRTELQQTHHALRCKLEELLSSNEINALLHRIDRLLETKTYPQPGPGPNHPWPPI